MSRGRTLAVTTATIAAVTAGCGLGPGPASEGEATLTVTRDYGSETLLEAGDPEPPASETVLRLIDREAEITTRYGGGFVHSIDEVAGELADGRSSDWFFFVNGVESDRGAAEVAVRGGDRIWWDYRDWTNALRTPAVVGSWPEPFAQASAGDDRLPVRVVCEDPQAPCQEVAERLGEEGVDAGVEAAAARADRTAPALRILVGPWRAIDDDPAAAQLDAGPQTSGVFARFTSGPRGWRLLALDTAARPSARLGDGAGLVAAVRDGDEPPTWLVTGTDLDGVEEAVSLLDDAQLARRYAVAALPGHVLALPAAGPG
jgi:hypothetical protein